MKKWLNNPYVVATLALGAVYSIYQQMSPLLGGNAANSVDHSVVEPIDKDPAFTGTIASPVNNASVQNTGRSGASELKADLAKAGRLGMAQRDPFHRAAQTKEVIVKSTKRKSRHIDQTAPPRLPTLSAVIAGPKSRYAVIDARIVEVGSALGKYTVREINSRSVSLEGPGGQRVLTLKPDRQGESHE